MATIIRFSSGTLDSAIIAVKESPDQVTDAWNGAKDGLMQLTRGDSGAPMTVNKDAVACWYEGPEPRSI